MVCFGNEPVMISDKKLAYIEMVFVDGSTRLCDWTDVIPMCQCGGCNLDDVAIVEVNTNTHEMKIWCQNCLPDRKM